MLRDAFQMGVENLSCGKVPTDECAGKGHGGEVTDMLVRLHLFTMPEFAMKGQPPGDDACFFLRENRRCEHG